MRTNKNYDKVLLMSTLGPDMKKIFSLVILENEFDRRYHIIIPASNIVVFHWSSTPYCIIYIAFY